MSVQGKVAFRGVDVAAEAGSDAICVVKKIDDVTVSGDLVIDVTAASTSDRMPILSGIQVEQSDLP